MENTREVQVEGSMWLRLGTPNPGCRKLLEEAKKMNVLQYNSNVEKYGMEEAKRMGNIYLTLGEVLSLNYERDLWTGTLLTGILILYCQTYYGKFPCTVYDAALADITVKEIGEEFTVEDIVTLVCESREMTHQEISEVKELGDIATYFLSGLVGKATYIIGTGCGDTN